VIPTQARTRLWMNATSAHSTAAGDHDGCDWSRSSRAHREIPQTKIFNTTNFSSRSKKNHAQPEPRKARAITPGARTKGHRRSNNREIASTSARHPVGQRERRYRAPPPVSTRPGHQTRAITLEPAPGGLHPPRHTDQRHRPPTARQDSYRARDHCTGANITRNSTPTAATARRRRRLFGAGCGISGNFGFKVPSGSSHAGTTAAAAPRHTITSNVTMDCRVLKLLCGCMHLASSRCTTSSTCVSLLLANTFVQAPHSEPSFAQGRTRGVARLLAPCAQR